MKRKGKVFSFKYLMYDIIKITGAIGLILYRPKHLYLDKKQKKIKGGAIISSNHVSLSDPISIMMGIWYRRLHMVAMDELVTNKLRKLVFTKWFLCIPISRTNFSMSSFKKIVDVLNDKRAVVIFPEGHVNVDEKGIQAFKSGMIMMALKSGTPIVPVYLKRRKNFFSRVVIAVGTPINISDYAVNGVVNLQGIERANQDIQNQEKELEKLVYKKERSKHGQK